MYECSFAAGEAAQVRLISALPDGSPSTDNNSAGTAYNTQFPPPGGPEGADQLAGAVAGNGSRVFWTAHATVNPTIGGPGAVYVRLNADREPTASGECSEAEAAKACTLEVSGAVSGEPARFWGASPDGSRALFTVESGPAAGLYLFDVQAALAGEEATRKIAGEALGVVGASEGLSRVYFASREADAAEEAEGAVAGEPNLYLYEAGEVPSYAFVARLAEADVATGISVTPAPVNERPDRRTARVSPGGGTLAFMSTSAALAREVAGYDNTDRASGEADAEIYRYRAAAGALDCVSCNPGGARPAGRKVKAGDGFLWAAAWLAPWENSLYAPRGLSADGKRLFFDSYEALVPADTDGSADVYEWEQPGAGDCTTARSSYIPASGGCLALISSGRSPSDSEFIDASPDGRDAFFLTAASLVPQDPGQIDLYDARELGGLPAPAAPRPPCEGEACQGAAPAPGPFAPASSSYSGPGNVKAPRARRCPKGKRRVRRGAKARCVKRRRHHRHRHHRRKHRRRGRAAR